jgi:hypothetical protein
MFQQGTALKAIKKVSLYENMVYDEGGNTVISQGTPFASISAGEQIGIVEATFTQQNFVYVQLFKPITVNLKKRYYALIFTDNIQELPAKTASSETIEYFAKCQPDSSVNIRLSASLTGTVKAKAKNGSLIGRSDGKVGNNGFLKFNLALGGVGYVHKDYVTKTKTAVTIEKTTEKVTVTNPLTGKDEEKARTTITTNEGWTVQDVVIKTVIGAVIGFIITRILGKIFKF